MTIEKGYRKRYESGNIPWDTGRADFNLIETVAGFPVPSCKALDIGCGTGDNSIWLAQKGFEIRGTDVSDIAVEKAREKAAAADAKCDFAVADFLKPKSKEALSDLFSTGAVFTPLSPGTTGTGSPERPPPIWKNPACG